MLAQCFAEVHLRVLVFGRYVNVGAFVLCCMCVGLPVIIEGDLNSLNMTISYLQSNDNDTIFNY